MKKYFRKFLSYSIYRKTLLAYSVSILCITIMIVVSLYGVFIVSIKQSSIESTQQLLTQLVIRVDNLKTDVDNVMSVVTSDSKTLKFVQNKEESKSDNYYLFLGLQSIKSSYSYIVDISVINFDKGICIQAIGNNNSFDNIEFASSLLKQQKYIEVRTIKKSQKEKHVVSFLQYLPYYNAAVIVDVNEDWFHYSIDDQNKEVRSAYIVDEDSRAVTSNARTIVGNQMISEYFGSIITGEEPQEESFVYDDEEKRQWVFFSYSPEIGWWFIDIQDYSYFNGKFQKISFTFIGIALMLVIFCALISILFNRKIRKPLMRLAAQCKNMMGSEEKYNADELDYLDIAIARGQHDRFLNENYIKALFLHNLIVGEQMPLFIPQKQLEVLKEQFKANNYCIMLLKIQNKSNLEKAVLEEAIQEEEFKIYRYAVCNLTDEIFGKVFHCTAIDMGEELVGLLFLLENKQINDEYVLCFKQLKECAYKMFHITVTGSMGIIINDQKDVFISYQKARQYLEMNQLINREDLIDSNNQININYQEKNRKLIESIIKYTEYNFNQPELSLKSISQVFGLSATYLGKIFRSIRGEAYSSFLTNYRLDKSKEVLLCTPKTVNEIAAETGFTNSTYFATLFKNSYGITPTAFRNQ